MTLTDVPAGTDGKARMQALLAGWAAQGWLRPLDAAFADFLWREVPDASPWLILAAALASHQLGRGHVCLDLAAVLEDPAYALSLPPEGAERKRRVDEVPLWPAAPASAGRGGTKPALRSPLPLAVTAEEAPAQDSEEPQALPGEVLAGLSLAQWQKALKHPELVGEGPGNTPLVRAGSRFYLRRYWQCERDVRSGIDRRLERSAGLQQALPIPALRRTLEVLFPPPGNAPPAFDWQKLACALAARSAFSIITGGPGTGKTTTVVRLLALLQALALGEGRPLRIRLAAPTGKAAARLNASIAGTVSDLPLAGLTNAEAIRAVIPVQVTTLHRLLGSRPDTRRFRHHAGNPLALDVLVIDEASMIDLEMMAAVLAALPDSARLVLLGDKDQLASVEAGAVLGELCRRARDGHYTPASCEWLHSVTGERIDPSLVDAAGTSLDQAVAMLRHSRRFSAESGIGRLAEAVNAGDTAALRRIRRQDHSDLSLLRMSGGDDPAFAALVIDGGPANKRDDGQPIRRGYRHYLETLRLGRPAPGAGLDACVAWAQTVLGAHGEFQVLCALRRGPWGIEGLNRRIARLLHEAGLIPASEGWYLGRPVLVTRNDYGLGLMNGDIGITLELPGGADGDWIARVAFPSGDGTGGIKWILPSRLQAVETVYALTVHKSQGSEFTHAAVVLPETLNPILTRELLYTGITRARSFLTLAQPGSDRLLEQAVQRRVLRASGLLAE